MKKPKVAVLIDWYLPGFRAGGPVKSCHNLVSSLKHKIDFEVITTNVDFGETSPYPNISPNQWIEQDAIKIYYFSKENLSFSKLKALLKERSYDFIYLNSLFSIPFTVFPLVLSRFFSLKSKIILAPRGMLRKSALAIKPTKKKVFLTIWKLLNLSRAVIFQATDEQELNDISKKFPKKEIRFASNLPYLNFEYSSPLQKESCKARLAFISRISVVKGLHIFLEQLAQTKIESEIIFDIFGPIEDENYWHSCLEIIAKMPKNIQVQRRGTLSYHEVSEKLFEYHFFILTTAGENFGHAIFEAFSAGKPVLISDQTPWTKLQEKNIGWDIDLAQAKVIQDIIVEMVEMNNEIYQKMSDSTFNFAKKYAENEQLIQDSLNLFS